MALTPFTPQKIADIQSGAALVENWGRPTSYFQRFLQGLLANLNGSFGDLAAIIAEIEAQQLEIIAAQATADAAYTYATVTLQNQINTERNRINGILLSAPVPYAGGFTAAAGFMSIPHGLPYTPNPGACTVFIRGFAGVGAGAYFVSIVSTDSSFLNVYVQDAAGAPISGTVNVYGFCSGY